MLDHGRIHQGHEKEIRDVSTFTEQHVGAARRSIWRDVTLTLRKHVGAARRSIWRDVALTLWKNQPSRFKHVTSIICYLCFMQYAWRCAFFSSTFMSKIFFFLNYTCVSIFLHGINLIKLNYMKPFFKSLTFRSKEIITNARHFDKKRFMTTFHDPFTPLWSKFFAALTGSVHSFIHSFISIQPKRPGWQEPVWPVWFWHTASWARSWR